MTWGPTMVAGRIISLRPGPRARARCRWRPQAGIGGSSGPARRASAVPNGHRLNLRPCFGLFKGVREADDEEKLAPAIRGDGHPEGSRARCRAKIPPCGPCPIRLRRLRMKSARPLRKRKTTKRTGLRHDGTKANRPTRRGWVRIILRDNADSFAAVIGIEWSSDHFRPSAALLIEASGFRRRRLPKAVCRKSPVRKKTSPSSLVLPGRKIGLAPPDLGIATAASQTHQEIAKAFR